MLLCRASCRFGTITPGLLHLLATLEEYGRFHDLTFVVLSGTDGAHHEASGHHRGEAIDFRCHSLETETSKRQLLKTLLERLGPDFTGALEYPGQHDPRYKTEHFHLQVRKGVTFHAPPVPTHLHRFSPV
jgi:hypothetical protein